MTIVSLTRHRIPQNMLGDRHPSLDLEFMKRPNNSRWGGGGGV